MSDFLRRCCRLRTSFGVAIEETSGIPVGLEYPHQQFPLLYLRLRHAAVALDAIEQSPDTANFGGSSVVANKLQHAVGVRRFPVHTRLKAAVVAPPHEIIPLSNHKLLPGSHNVHSVVDGE